MEEILTETGELQERHTDVMRMEKRPFLKTDYIGFNLAESADGWKPWHDSRVRQALSLAVDREGIARTLRRGTAVPTSGFVPPALLQGYASNRPVQDLEAAHELLANVRDEHPFPWPPFVISTTPDYADLCAALQYQWQLLGVEVEIDVVSSSTQRERVANGKATLFRKSWLADYPDAENFLSLFRTVNFAPGGPNYTHFSDAAFDAGMEQAVKMTESSERLVMYAEMHDLVMFSMPVIPLFHDQVTHFLRNEVTGWEINSVNRLDLRRVQKIPRELASNP
jgi:peptide/nickel transport system substrate-binding protein